MNFDVIKPCNNCPFLRKGGIRLRPARVEDLSGSMLSSSGGTFSCHKTTDKKTKESHCAGALIFALKNENMTQMMRIAYRLEMFDPEDVMKDTNIVDSVFSTKKEMLAAQECP